MSQLTQIIELLSDGRYHCPTNELFMKDDRRRFSDLREKGFEFHSPKCDLGHNHNSGVVMRKITKWPEEKKEEGIDWTKDNIFDAIHRPDLKESFEKTMGMQANLF